MRGGPHDSGHWFLGREWGAARPRRLQSEPPHDWRMLLASKNKEVARLNGVYNNLLRGAGCDLLEGKGTLVGPHNVMVELPDGRCPWV